MDRKTYCAQAQKVEKNESSDPEKVISFSYSLITPTIKQPMANGRDV